MLIHVCFFLDKLADLLDNNTRMYLKRGTAQTVFSFLLSDYTFNLPVKMNTTLESGGIPMEQKAFKVFSIHRQIFYQSHDHFRSMISHIKQRDVKAGDLWIDI